MTALAHDIARDQFDNVMGSRRGGGASHWALPAVTDAATFDQALRELARLPSAVEENVRRALNDHLTVQYSISVAALIARTFLTRLDFPPAETNEYIERNASMYVTGAVLRMRPLADQPFAEGKSYITSQLASLLTGSLIQSCDTPEGAGLRKLLPNHDFPGLDIAAPRLETHSDGEPLLNSAEWEAAFSAALTATTVADAEQLILSVLDTLGIVTA